LSGEILPGLNFAAIQKVRKAEDGWNSRNPQQVSLAYTPDSKWRRGRYAIKSREQDGTVMR
jgi:hypothetical protein